MSGHSKWHNIQGRKNAQDAKRGKVFQKLSREIYMAAKSGGPDPSGNPTLRMVMDKARAANMPKTNIERAIKKAEGNSDEHYDEITYEGYAPGGVAVLVEALTDNKNRTASDVRVAFTRNGGSLGATGSVAYMFDRKGYIVIDRSTTDADEDQVLLDVMDAGGDDLETSDDAFEIYTDPKQFTAVRDALEKAGYKLANAELTMIPQNTTPVPADKKEQFTHLIDALEDNDDVSNVYTAAADDDEITYEGYAPGGVAVLVEALTDNKNRTASDVRVAFTRNGGSLGATGSVAYMFDRKGYIVIDRSTTDADEDQVLLDVMDAGGDDLETSDDAFEIYTDPKQFTAVRDALEKAGYKLANAELTMIPQNTTPVPADKKEQFTHLIDALEDNDDVSNVYTAAADDDE